MLMDLVSVVFDLRDSAQYLLGDRGIVSVDPSAGLPVVSLLVIAASIAAVMAYALGFPRDLAAASEKEA